MKRFFWKSQFVICLVLILAGLQAASAQQDLLDLDFQGHYRADSKTSIIRSKSTGKISRAKTYASLSALLAELPLDAFMRDKYPNLNKETSSLPNHREKEELRNVSLNCWIHAVKFEGSADGDNDFHVIVGSKPDLTDASFLTVEVSGLPKSGVNLADLRKARKQFLDLFPGFVFIKDFKQLSPAKKVRIKGSLFFDGDHKAGCASCPGPSYAKPETVWEIHPMYSIQAID